MHPHGPDYEATVLRCRACEAREALGKKWQRDEHTDLAGAKFAVTQSGGDQ